MEDKCVGYEWQDLSQEQQGLEASEQVCLRSDRILVYGNKGYRRA